MIRDSICPAFWRVLLAGVITLLTVAQAPAQVPSYDSGSTGADGPLVFSGAGPLYGGMVYDSVRNRIVFVENDGGVWEWDDIEWKQVSTGGPAPRYGGALAFDAVRGRTVLFGGTRSADQVLLSDTWEWDGTDWTELQVAAPPARRYHAMSTSAAGVILFGGENPSQVLLSDTWEWNGTAWTDVSTPGPSPRNHSAMAYDSTRSRNVLFGGDTGSLIDDTWEWNGSSWAQVGSGGPSARYYHMLAFDQARGLTVLWGGLYSSDNDTWEWDGANWVQRNAGNPGQVTGFGLSYSPAGKVAIYGGGVDKMYEWDGAEGLWKRRPTVGSPAVIDMSDFPDGILNVTELRIPADFTVTVKPNVRNTPLVILCSDDAVIEGLLDLRGESYGGVTSGTEAKGGPGGFRGGLGGVQFNVSGSHVGEAGYGPGGGAPTADIAGAPANGAGHAGVGQGPGGGAIYGNVLIQPLTGGSGGSGSPSSNTQDGYGGGGGGGALLIASSTRIKLNGYIYAMGGDSYHGGGGSGGAVRLVAPTVEGVGQIRAHGGIGNYADGGDGRIRIEAYDLTFSNNTYPPWRRSLPYPPFPETVGTIRITNIAGQVVPSVPEARFDAPDVTFTAAGPVTIDLATTNIPQGTVLKVRITSGRTAQVIDSSPVAANGTASASATVPAGVGSVIAYSDAAP